MTESEIQRSIIKAAESLGHIVFRMNAGKAGRYNTRLAPPGTPDLFIVGPRFSLWVEVKGPGGSLLKSQIKMHGELSGMGQDIIVARSVDDFLIFIENCVD